MSINQNNQNVMLFMKSKKNGSVLVFSLIVLAIVLSATLSIAAVNVSNRKSAAATAQSVQSFQTADTATEKVMKAIYNGNYIDLTTLYSAIKDTSPSAPASTCPGVLNLAVAGGTAKVNFSDTTGAALIAADCTSTLWRDKLARIKVEGSGGTGGGPVRVIEVGIAPLSSMAWGANDSGQLGDGTTGIDRHFPVSTIGGSKWKSVSVGNNTAAKGHVLAVKTDGTLWAWGQNDAGQIGDGTTTKRTSPIQIGTDNNWKSVSAGYYDSFAIRTNDTLWAWGAGVSYELGNNSTSDVLTPVQIGTGTNCSPTCPASGWKAVSSGSGFTIAISMDNELWSWGAASNYQLGNSISTGHVKIPTKITACSPSCPGGGWKVISAGSNQTLAIGSDDKLYVWGDGGYGKLGTGSTAAVSLPTIISPSATWKSVSTGNNHSVGVQMDGSLWSWGRNQRSQLGIGVADSLDHPVPIKITSPLSTNWISVSTGGGHSFALQTNGTNQELWAWGANEYGQLGDGTTVNSSTPVQIPGNWQAIDGGDDFSIGVRR